MRFRNDDGSVIHVNDLGQKVGPFEEFDFPGYDEKIHGPVAGCSPVTEDGEGKDGTDEDDQAGASGEEPAA